MAGGDTAADQWRSADSREVDRVAHVLLTMLIGALCCAAAWPASLAAEETPPVLTRLYSRLRPVFQRHYSEVSSQR